MTEYYNEQQDAIVQLAAARANAQQLAEQLAKAELRNKALREMNSNLAAEMEEYEQSAAEMHDLREYEANRLSAANREIALLRRDLAETREQLARANAAAKEAGR